MSELVPGSSVAGSYRLESPIGEGTSGVVYRAVELSSKRSVAIKILRGEIARRPEARVRFLREARLAGTLNHANAVSVIDFGTDGNLLYLVMELVVGQTLRQRLNQHGALPLPILHRIGAEVADALCAAHKLHLVHRDIKPQNILLEPGPRGDERVRVLDFGLAFLANSDSSLGRLTDEGIALGTPQYMSPEQAEGRLVGPASDIYGLGCMLYEMAAGYAPFGGSVVEVLTRHLYMPPMPLHALGLDRPIAPELDALIMAMLAKTPSARPPSVAVVRALRKLLMMETVGITAPAEEAEPPSPAPASPALPGPDQPPPAGQRMRAPMRVALFGVTKEETVLALRVNDIEPIHVDVHTLPVDIEAVYMHTDDIDLLARIRTRIADDVPVLTSIAPERSDQLATIVRAGFADALVRPVRGAELARKLRRSYRRRMRSELHTSDQT